MNRKRLRIDKCSACCARWYPIAVVILATVLIASATADANDLVWARRAGGTNFDLGKSISVDSSGDSYVTGYFWGSATFGAGEPNETTLDSLGAGDIFVAQYDLDGKLVWAKRAGGTSSDQGHVVGVDASRNSYITGWFSGSATFGAGEPNETTLDSADGSGDIFVAQYDPDGKLVWAKRAGGIDFDEGFGLTPDDFGNSYVCGRFTGSATFGAGEPNETTLDSAGDADIFVAKYDPDGKLVWAKRAGGIDFDESFGTGVDGSGNSYVTGVLRGLVTFGAGEPNETTLNSAGRGDIFVAKYDPDGKLVWAKRAGGTDSDESNDIEVDATGNSYVTGAFRGSATFGAGEPNETVFNSAVTGGGIFAAKYDAGGALVWAKRAGETDVGRSIAADNRGNSYVTGSFTGSATFGAGEPNETILDSAGDADIFVAKFDSDGKLGWAKRAGGTDMFEAGYGIAVDGSGNSYVTGAFSGSSTFGTGEPNETTLDSAGLDIFVAKYHGAILDVDANGSADALSDGILVLRFLFKFTGDSLVDGGVVPPDCTRCTAQEIEEYLRAMGSLLDVDGNGQTDALTDGILVLRFLFQFTGDALVGGGVVASDCTRCIADEIEALLEGLLP